MTLRCVRTATDPGPSSICKPCDEMKAGGCDSGTRAGWQGRVAKDGGGEGRGGEGRGGEDGVGSGVEMQRGGEVVREEYLRYGSGDGDLVLAKSDDQAHHEYERARRHQAT
jgi:hypothetical protein